MADERVITSPHSASSELATNKVLRNTYLLLSMTLLFSAAMAGVSMAIQPGHIMALVAVFASFGLLFAIRRFANSTAGLVLTFLFTGLLGFSLGPILNQYLAMFSNGAQMIVLALSGTGAIFLGLSAYALTTRKDFSFMGGFLMAGILVAVLASFALLFFQVPMLHVALSGVFILLMSGLILFETSRIIHGGETNYILATVSLYVALYNLFTSLLMILGIFGDD